MFLAFIASLTTREIALCMWTCIGIGILLYWSKTRPSIIGILRAFFSPQLLPSYFAMFVYIAFVIWLFKRAELWQASMLHETVLWIVAVPSVLFLNCYELRDNPVYVRKLLINVAVIGIIVGFFLNLHTLPLFFEMIILPVEFVLGGLSAMAKFKPEFKPAGISANWLLSILILFEIGYSLFVTIHTGLSWPEIQNFFVSPVLTLELMPFLYVLTIIWKRYRYVPRNRAL